VAVAAADQLSVTIGMGGDAIGLQLAIADRVNAGGGQRAADGVIVPAVALVLPPEFEATIA